MSLLVNAPVTQTDGLNAVYLVRTGVSNLSFAVDNLVNPIGKISEEARSHLTFGQRVAIENSFSLRTHRLKSQLAHLKQEIAQPPRVILSNLNNIRSRLETLRHEYSKSEMGFGYYIDLLHTRGMMRMGKVLRGYDYLATQALRIFLTPLRRQIPTVVVYLEQVGDGAAIMREGIALWDRFKNPCAVIKIPQNSINTPRSSVFHEAGHQLGTITGLDQEAADLLYNTVRAAGGSRSLAEYYRNCTREIVADQIATQLTNWITAITIYNIYSSLGSVLGTAARMFMIDRTDPHLAGYLRIRSNIESCRLALGRGPWDQLEKALDILYPISLARGEAGNIIRQSLPILPSICRALARTRLRSFGGKSFEEMYPIKLGSLNSIRRVLNVDLSNFSVDMTSLVQNPILTMVAFGALQMLGGKSINWITEHMRVWLEELGKKELN
jgi:hypothetical protein